MLFVCVLTESRDAKGVAMYREWMQKKASLTSAEHRMILDSSECGRAAEGKDVA